MHRSIFPNVQLIASVWSSVWGWHVLLYFKEVPNFFHSVIQKWLRNLVSQSEVTDLGTPCRWTISLKKMWATFEASAIFQQGMKCASFENWSTTTKTESTSRSVWGRPSTKWCSNPMISTFKVTSSVVHRQMASATLFRCPYLCLSTIVNFCMKLIYLSCI